MDQDASRQTKTSRRTLLATAGAGAALIGLAGTSTAVLAAEPAATPVAISNGRTQFLYMLADTYDAEKRFLAAQKMALTQATDPRLRAGIQLHITQTAGHITIVQQIFKMLGTMPPMMMSTAAAALVASAMHAISSATTNAVRDSVIDASLDRSEHFEIASYQGLIAGARVMKQQQIALMLQGILNQEMQASHTLESLAPSLLQTAG